MTSGEHGNVHMDGGSSVGRVAGLAISSQRARDAADGRSLTGVEGGVSDVRSIARRAYDLSLCALFWPWKIADTSIVGRDNIIRRLEAACRNDRRRGIAGHWTYDLARHDMLRLFVKVERAERAAVIKSMGV